jgi:hypothetical protein
LNLFTAPEGLPPWVCIFDGIILKNIGEKFSEMQKMIFWNEVIKVGLGIIESQLESLFYYYYSAKGLFLLLDNWSYLDQFV